MGVTKGDITEICSLNNPPEVVKQITCAFATLHNNKNVADWGREWSKNVLHSNNLTPVTLDKFHIETLIYIYSDQ